jgi:hypothetical protein
MLFLLLLYDGCPEQLMDAQNACIALNRLLSMNGLWQHCTENMKCFSSIPEYRVSSNLRYVPVVLLEVAILRWLGTSTMLQLHLMSMTSLVWVVVHEECQKPLNVTQDPPAQSARREYTGSSHWECWSITVETIPTHGPKAAIKTAARHGGVEVHLFRCSDAC